MAVFYNFDGVYAGRTDSVDVDFNESTGEITAKTNALGSTAIFYDEYLPDVPEGTLLASFINGGVETKLYFQKYYPFAYSEVVAAPPPVIPTTPLIINSINVTPQTTIGVPDGTATINVSGGTSPYNYSLDGVNVYSSNVFNSLTPGDYTVRVTDNEGAIVNGSFTILSAPQPPEPPVVDPVKDVIALSDSEIEIQNAYKRVQVLSVFGKAPSVIANGDFETYDGQNWEFWVKYGGIDVSRSQRSIKNSAGELVPIDNYAIKFNQIANAGRYLQHSDIPIQFGDTVKFTYRVGKTVGTGTSSGTVTSSNGYVIPATYRTFYLSKIRIKVGDWYLYNADYGNNYQWVKQVATVSHMLDNPKGDLSNYIVNFNAPSSPITGAMVIQFFGFQKVQTVQTEEYKPTPFVTIPAIFQSTDLNEYDGIEIDDIKADKSSQNGDNDISGILNISDNLRNFSQKPDPKEILFGDYFYRSLQQSELDNLYAIKYNEKYTQNWYEYNGGSAVKVPFGLALAKSILTAYQKPFRKWNGGLNLMTNATSFGYQNVFSFLVPNKPAFNRKQFCVLGGEINLKTRQFINVKLAEIFDRPAKSNDNSVPSYPNMPDPDITQDPTTVIEDGIFTHEFTNEFN